MDRGYRVTACVTVHENADHEIHQVEESAGAATVVASSTPEPVADSRPSTDSSCSGRSRGCPVSGRGMPACLMRTNIIRPIAGLAGPVLLSALVSSVFAADLPGASEFYTSPNGITEACVAIEHADGGAYSDADAAQERALCAIDFYSGGHALCPKTFSTSPGTLVYDISSGRYAGRATAFEADHCAEHHVLHESVSGAPVSFKMTMNRRDTSATFAPASLLYYHFSRYFGTEVLVPVSVYRSMDREAHYQRVVRAGVAASSRSGSSAMNRAGWQTLERGAKDPASYRPSRELYTDNGRQIFGVLLENDGRRYGAEINGTRESGWGSGQNRDFQETAPFLALRHDAPLAAAVRHGIETARRDPILDDAMQADPTPLQMLFWMTELSEIVLLDFISSQQDRVGNIDYVEYWYWIEDDRIRQRRASGRQPPTEIAGFAPERVRRSVINDNDAAGMVPYANFAKTTGMLENLRHFPPETYRRLQRLAADFENAGPLYRWLSDSFGLTERQVAQARNNALEAARILAAACRDGRLHLDLDPRAFLAGEPVPGEKAGCSPG
jgi:hypothetical protein